MARDGAAIAQRKLGRSEAGRASGSPARLNSLNRRSACVAVAAPPNRAYSRITVETDWNSSTRLLSGDLRRGGGAFRNKAQFVPQQLLEYPLCTAQLHLLFICKAAGAVVHHL